LEFFSGKPKMSTLKIRIQAKEQLLHVMEADSAILSFPVSTSRFGLGEIEGSFRTPTGRFRICEKIGAEHPINTVFRGRVRVPDPPDWATADDLITSRILWLDGLEDHNANTRERYIYIHGTNQEQLIGQAASRGCIRMRNQHVIQLFDLIDVGTEVEILP
jgi:lipoprotein-anchoring transpeptidase ErfK/SrfK